MNPKLGLVCSESSEIMRTVYRLTYQALNIDILLMLLFISYATYYSHSQNVRPYILRVGLYIFFISKHFLRRPSTDILEMKVLHAVQLWLQGHSRSQILVPIESSSIT